MHQKVLKNCSIQLHDITMELKKSPINHLQYISIDTEYTGLQNHCYVYTLLQFMRRLLQTWDYNINNNNNQEGSLVNTLLQASRGSSSDLLLVKQRLANYNYFFDGKSQRDAYECFNILTDIFHIGTN